MLPDLILQITMTKKILFQVAVASLFVPLLLIKKNKRRRESVVNDQNLIYYDLIIIFTY
jgi:hypothetical protein